MGWGFFFSCNGPTVAALTGLPGCAGYTALALTTTPNGGVPAPSDCGLANCLRLHTACSEPARANCSMCDPVLVAGWGFSKKGLVCTATGSQRGHCTRGWGLAPTEVTAPEAGDSHSGAHCTHVVESWNREHGDTMQRARQGDLHRVPRLWWIVVSLTECTLLHSDTMTRCSEPGRAICIVRLGCGG